MSKSMLESFKFAWQVGSVIAPLKEMLPADAWPIRVALASSIKNVFRTLLIVFTTHLFIMPGWLSLLLSGFRVGG
ncbi:conserved protein of unknown function [Pseudomonas marincola]|uniref:Uncharacterized protein n=1 Tax=Pseudomonas marincola TaxID=437900 RepID=A0A653E6Z5_9PSED|nr:conserved protein of unknown function [Pseudomonas marincola]